MLKQVTRRIVSFALIFSIVFSLSTLAIAVEIPETTPGTAYEAIPETSPVHSSEFALGNTPMDCIANAPDAISLDKSDLPNFTLPTTELEVNAALNIEIGSFVPEATGFAANRPPVAGLQYVILNPESLVNGKITTQTQIAWLWSYNGEDFTYDPDGDEIIDRRVYGISSSDIVGTLNGNIGFVTQFITAAQYVMSYQVEDEHGAFSNILEVTISVEPVDGHARPTAILAANTTSPRENETMFLTCVNSRDYAGQPTVGFNGWVFDELGNKTLLLNYVVTIDGVPQFDAQSAYLRFPDAGQYEVWISVKDSLGAWSDWEIFALNVKDGTTQLCDVYISTSDGIPTDPVPPNLEHRWLDYARSKSMAQYNDNPYDIWNAVTSREAPLALSGRKSIGYSFTVSGYLKYTDGTPKANAVVGISLPITNGKSFYKTADTDATGYFTMTTDMQDYFTNIIQLPINVYSTNAGYKSDYGFVGTLGVNMVFVTPSTLRVYSSGAEYTEPVMAITGHFWNALLGDKWFLTTESNKRVWKTISPALP